MAKPNAQLLPSPDENCVRLAFGQYILAFSNPIDRATRTFSLPRLCQIGALLEHDRRTTDQSSMRATARTGATFFDSYGNFHGLPSGIGRGKSGLLKRDDLDELVGKNR